MPGEDSSGFDDGGDLFKGLLAELVTDLSEVSALGVSELYASFNLVAQDAIFGGEIFVSQQEFIVDRTGDTSQQYLPIHEIAPFISPSIRFDYG